jgi:hypothetical protein
MPTVPRFDTGKSTLGAIVALALSAALAIGFVSACWRTVVEVHRGTARTIETARVARDPIGARKGGAP